MAMASIDVERAEQEPLADFSLSDDETGEAHPQLLKRPCSFTWRMLAVSLAILCVLCFLACFLVAAGHMGSESSSVEEAVSAASLNPKTIEKAAWEWEVKEAVAEAKAKKAVWCWKHRIYGVHCDEPTMATTATTATTTTTTTTTATTTASTTTPPLVTCPSGAFRFFFVNSAIQNPMGIVAGCISGLSCGQVNGAASSLEVLFNSAGFGTGEYVQANAQNRWTVGANCKIEAFAFTSYNPPGARGSSLTMHPDRPIGFARSKTCVGLSPSRANVHEACRANPLHFEYVP